MRDIRPGIAVVTRKTRMQNLLGRYATRGQARFRMTRAKWRNLERTSTQITGGMLAEGDEDFDLLEDEDQTYQAAIGTLHQDLDLGLPLQIIDREFVPNFDFARFEVVVVVGQDGLVANVAKYVGDVPIVAVNPDPKRIDGVLLPFALRDVRRAVQRVLGGRFKTRNVTLAEVKLSDEQRLLAFNDLFVGASSHVSARYKLSVGRKSETHSSSGIVISTGAGSTGWLSSIFNMAEGVSHFCDGPAIVRPHLRWEDGQLLWGVREPFISRSSQASLVMGRVNQGEELVVESMMPSGGVIFSDGVEADFLEFSSGTIARIFVSKQRARLVVKD